MADWLLTSGCTHVAIESTGVYWRQVFNRLEANFAVLLVNTHHIKAGPGRKTEVRDCDWICELLRYGLLKASFIPLRHIREFRDRTRQRHISVRDRTAVANRISKLLEPAHIKLGQVATNVLGLSGRLIL